jgi:hypothetical protein
MMLGRMSLNMYLKLSPFIMCVVFFGLRLSLSSMRDTNEIRSIKNETANRSLKAITFP